MNEVAYNKVQAAGATERQIRVLKWTVAGLFAAVVGLTGSFVYVTVNLFNKLDAVERAEQWPGGGHHGRGGLGPGHTGSNPSIQEIVTEILKNETLWREKQTDNHRRREFVPQGPFTLHNDSSRAYLAKPMAHLTGKSGSGHSRRHGRGEGTTRIQHWESRQGLATVANGMTHRDGAIRVPVDGLYYVYSQLYFRHVRPPAADGSYADDTGDHQLLHSTYKKSATYPEKQKIMKSARTRCWSKDSQYGLLSSYQGGVFRLRAGDRLFVQVSNVAMVSFEEAASYFGAFMI
ncbi:tumor necrosis factor ligand superfamily member 10-like [Branchiostoma lanceolatum]|uniref:tumor necrosis factor ligand superfamily member 10-like n=1 Tax=Branchiostoma lanceolatum TaxID=7740 RepID=UPI00345460AB